MASTITSVRDEVIERLKIAQGTGAQPSNAMIEGFVRAGFKRIWAIAQPVFRGEFTVGAGLDITIDATELAMVYFVAGPNDFLIQNAEYVETSTGVLFRTRGYDDIAASDDVVAWYSLSPTDFNSASSIESTCVFGPDWLEEAATMYAEVQCLKRMSRVHDSGGSQSEAQAWVTVDEELTKHVGELAATKQAWLAEMERRQAFRLRNFYAKHGMAR